MTTPLYPAETLYPTEALYPSDGGTGTVVVPPAAGVIQPVTFWALNTDGTYNVALPDVVSWQLSPVTGTPGAVTLDYPAAGRNFSVLRNQVTNDRDLQIAIWIAGGDTGSLRALLNTSDGDDVAESAVWRFSGNFLNVRMEEAWVAARTSVVTPPTGPPPTTNVAAFRVYSATAGSIMATLMQEAQLRGTLADIAYNFNATYDTRGIHWSRVITLEIAPGTTYDQVLDALVKSEMCEWEIIGSELVMWEEGTRGVDRTLTNPPLILRAGQTIHDAPRKHSVRNAGTSVLVAGGNGLYNEQSNSTALARRGRRIEKFVSQGSLTDTGSLAAYGAIQVNLLTTGVMEVSHGIALEPNGPRPLLDYTVGDWIFSDTGHGLERLRIVQLTVSGDKTGVISAGVTLNDVITDDATKLSKRVDGIIGGTTITGTSSAPISTDIDRMPPAAPLGLTVTSLAQPSAESIPRSAVFAAWAAVITNQDTTAIADLAGYIVQWRYTPNSGVPALAPSTGLAPSTSLAPSAGTSGTGGVTGLTTSWQQLATVAVTNTSWGDVIAGASIDVQVAAIDTSANQSLWSTVVTITTATDNTPPPVPSAPVIVEFLGTLTLTWDGKGSARESMPGDFQGVEIHRSVTSNFTPSSLTFIESMLGPGSRNYPGLPAGVTQFFRLISYDKTTPAANRSAPSAQGSGTPSALAFDDIPFKDNGNDVEDGSFEVPGSRAMHAARSSTAWSFVTGGADHGAWFARGTGSSGTGQRELVLSTLLTAIPTKVLAYRFALRGTGVNGDLSARIRWHLNDGSTVDNVTTFTPGQATGGWTAQEIPSITAPASTLGFEIVLALMPNCTAGTWDLDRVEVREVIGTLLVQDAAITNAKIVDLSAGKITAGTITAVMIMAGLLRTAATGLRYELDSAGLRFYDASNNLVIDLNRAAGSASITGDFKTATGNDRIVLSNAGGAPEIDLYRSAAGVDKAYITALGNSVDGTIRLDLHSGPDKVFSPNREMFLSMLPQQILAAYVDRPGGNSRGGELQVNQVGFSLANRNSNGSGGTNGAFVIGDATGLDAKTVIGNTARSELTIGDGTAILNVNNSAGTLTNKINMVSGSFTDIYSSADMFLTGDNSLTLQTNDRIRMFGRFGSFLDYSVASVEALTIVEKFTSGSPSGFTQSFTYGPTMASIMIPIASVDGNLCRWTVVNNTTTGFGVLVDGPDGHWIRAAVFRK